MDEKEVSGGMLCTGCGKHFSPTLEGILQVLASLQSSNPFKTRNPLSKLPAISELPAPPAPLLCVFSPGFSPTPATLEKAFPSVQVENDPPWG